MSDPVAPWVADAVRVDDDLDYTGEELAPTGPHVVSLLALAALPSEGRP